MLLSVSFLLLTTLGDMNRGSCDPLSSPKQIQSDVVQETILLAACRRYAADLSLM